MFLFSRVCSTISDVEVERLRKTYGRDGSSNQPLKPAQSFFRQPGQGSQNQGARPSHRGDTCAAPSRRGTPSHDIHTDPGTHAGVTGPSTTPSEPSRPSTSSILVYHLHQQILS
ncbi:hypothetical protein O6H91_12G006900 [Diphasiastrum complanatum]|uniref:Uncharacterized protein n=1 Tax=Diphasiastrum complanatum TaxID=34168 RepID=A0ACC2BYN1_DIPCM|nr:hypothetical protein O6H91_12G006900 [Diphasiastrum complanatum]